MGSVRGVVEKHLARRAIAYTVDAAITSGIIMTTMIALLAGTLLSPSADELSTPAVVLVAASFLTMVPLAFLFFLLRDSARRGSPGKRLVGLVVVDATTARPCTVKQSFVRNLVLLVVGTFDLLVPFFRSDGRRLGDLAAGTIVVRSA